MKKIFSKIRYYCPVASMVIAIIAIISLVLHIIFINNSAFADFFNRYIASTVRIFLAKLTSWYPVSLAESVLITMPIWLTALIIIIVKTIKKELRHLVRFTAGLLSVLLSLYSVFVFGFASGYHGSTVDEKLDLNRHDVSTEELKDTAIKLIDKLNSLADKIDFVYLASSRMPYTFSEMNRKLIDAYSKLSAKYDFIPDFSSNVKQIMLSEPMTYSHISGVYTYFTGEANINVNFPDYTLPYTTAHELAHQRGISKEDEANFIAFLVCIESDDPYIQYSGYQSVYEYVADALVTASASEYGNVLITLDKRIIYEMKAYNEFFAKYKKNIIADVSNIVNDTYLQIQGQEAGTQSYGMVVDLTVAYYESIE